MSDSPLFSVIIPVYNRRDLICATLASVESQTFRDFELILVDDGSTDGSAEFLRARGLRVIEQKNSGPGVARNTGAKEASGQYLAFLDSDDRWFPSSLQKYAEVIRNNHAPAFVTGNPMVVSEFDQLPHKIAGEIVVESFADYYESSDKWRWFGVSSFVIRRDVFSDVGGFAPGRINGEDAELAMRLGTTPGFIHISSPPTFAYLAHDGNVTLDSQKSEAGINLLIKGEREGRFPGGPTRVRQRWEIISRHIRPFAIEAARAGKNRTAIALYRSVIRECFSRGRWKFLIGLPLLMLRQCIGRQTGTGLSKGQ